MSTAEIIPIEGHRWTTLDMVRNAREILAQATTVEDVKDVRDKAEAIRQYLKVQGESLEAQNQAAAVKLWAERRMGELLQDRHMHPGASWSHDETTISVSLSEIGVNKSQSFRYQRIASIPESDFTAVIDRTQAEGKELTSALMQRVAAAYAAAQCQPEPADTDADLDPPPFDVIEAMGNLRDRIRVILADWPEEHRRVFAGQLRIYSAKIDLTGDC